MKDKETLESLVEVVLRHVNARDIQTILKKLSSDNNVAIEEFTQGFELGDGICDLLIESEVKIIPLIERLAEQFKEERENMLLEEDLYRDRRSWNIRGF